MYLNNIRQVCTKLPLKLPILASYSLLLIVLMSRHEMWRDELQTWTIVVHSKSIGELLYNIRYEGHPALWYVILWSFSKLSPDPVVVQSVHACLTIATASLILFKSPFKIREKVLLLFSYYFLFEYSVISRNYQIGILLTFGIISFWPQISKRPILGSIGLALLFHTNLYSILIGLGIGIGLLLEFYLNRKLFTRSTTCFIILIGISLFLSIWSIQTPTDQSYSNGWYTQLCMDRILYALKTVYKGFLPIPHFRLTFWNSDLITDEGTFKLVSGVLLAVFLLILISWFYRHDFISMAVFIVPTLLMLFFAYTRFAGSIRHNGHYMLALIASYWIYRTRTPVDRLRSLSIVNILLSIQVLVGMFAAYADGRYAFSMAKATAQFIHRKYPSHTIIVGSYNYLLTPVSAYLKRDIYSLNTGSIGSYVLWNQSNWNWGSEFLKKPDSLLFAQYVSVYKKNPNSVLIMTYPPARYKPISVGDTYSLHSTLGSYRFRCVAAFSPAIVPEENYFVYEIDK